MLIIRGHCDHLDDVMELLDNIGVGWDYLETTEAEDREYPRLELEPRFWLKVTSYNSVDAFILLRWHGSLADVDAILVGSGVLSHQEITEMI